MTTLTPAHFATSFHHQSTMAQQPAANENTLLLTPVHLQPSMGQQIEGRDAHTVSSALGSNTVIQPSIEGELLSSSTSSGSRTIVQLDHEDEGAPLLLSASQHSTAASPTLARLSIHHVSMRASIDSFQTKCIQTQSINTSTVLPHFPLQAN